MTLILEIIMYGMSALLLVPLYYFFFGDPDDRNSISVNELRRMLKDDDN